MKCPHCEYEHGFTWHEDEPVNVEGDHGGFWKLPNVMERHDSGSYNDDRETTVLYACPKCKKTFIDN